MKKELEIGSTPGEHLIYDLEDLSYRKNFLNLAI
jgi:hypothetical protein